MQDCKTINEVNRGSVTNFPLHVWWSEPQIDTTRHQHAFTELVLVFAGNAVHCLGESAVRSVTSGDLFVIPPGVFHTFTNCSPDFSLVNIVFEPNELPMPVIDAQLLPGFHALFNCRKQDGDDYPFMHLEASEFERIRESARRMRDEDNERSSGYRFAMLGLFMTILSDLARKFSHSLGRNPQIFLHVNGVISYINRHFKEEITQARLCRIAGMARSTLQRNFLNTTGVSPRQYQIRLRIAEAALLLKSSSKTIDEIASEVGFANRYLFTRHFCRMTGNSPAKYRKDTNG